MGIERVIDNTNLKPYASNKDIIDLIDQTAKYKMYSVMINPSYASFARKYIDQKEYKLVLGVVIDFPFGSNPNYVRKEMIRKVAKFVDEVDVVAPISLVKSGKWEDVAKDINSLVKTAHDNDLVIKIIVEDAYTRREEKIKLYEIVAYSGADFIKTSTGYEDKEYANLLGNKTGAQVENVSLMAEISKKLNPSLGIKVSGGIRSYEQAIQLEKAAQKPLDPKRFRIGTSHALEIINGSKHK